VFRIVLILIIILFQISQAQAAYKATVDEDLDYYEAVSDTVYGAGWNGDTTTAPSKNAVYDKIETLGHDAVTLGTDADVLLGLSTQQLTLDSQAANLIFAGPGSGAAADPTFRALVDNDVPNNITITETDPTALLTAGTDNVKDTHIDWGTGAGQVNPADFADQDIGDITVTTGAWAVEDESHAHTTTTISGLDISADTNLTAGDALTLTDDDIDFDGGAAPGGELGGTWASPTIDDSLAVTSWNLTTPTITTSLTTSTPTTPAYRPT